MKNIILILSLFFLISGCGFLQNQKVNFDACMSDPECKAQAESWQGRIENASTIVASGVPVPGAAAAPKVLGYMALGVAALIGGSALRKKKKEETNVNP